MIPNALYELSIVNEAVVPVQVESSRGAVIWTQSVPVRRLIHQERFRRSAEPSPEHVEAMIRGAAAEGFIETLRKTALDAGLQWLLLNLGGADYAFLFSTRRQEHLAEMLGFDAGTVETAGRRFAVLTDRRIPHDGCYGVQTRNYRVFGRWERTPTAVRVYLSDFIRVGAGRTAVQMNADEAIHYLRAAQWGNRLASPTSAKTTFRPPQSALSNAEPFSSTDGSHSVSPGIPTVAAASVKSLLRESTLPAQSSANAPSSLQNSTCPLCGGELFFLSKTHTFCRSCDWNNLESLAAQLPVEQ